MWWAFMPFPTFSIDANTFYTCHLDFYWEDKYLEMKRLVAKGCVHWELGSPEAGLFLISVCLFVYLSVFFNIKFAIFFLSFSKWVTFFYCQIALYRSCSKLYSQMKDVKLTASISKQQRVIRLSDICLDCRWKEYVRYI